MLRLPKRGLRFEEEAHACVAVLGKPDFAGCVFPLDLPLVTHTTHHGTRYRREDTPP